MKNLFKEVKSEFYLNRYLKFITHFQNLNVKNEYVENHHILPRKLYPQYTKEKWNQVNLPYRAHYLAHYMLAKAIGGRMWFAFTGMNYMNKSKLSKLNSVLFETGKIEHRNYLQSVDLESGLTVAKLIGLKVSQSANMIQENGLTIAQNAGILGAKTRSKIDPKTGMSINQLNAINMSITKQQIQDNGLTLAQNGAIKAAASMSKVTENGLTIYQMSGIKGSETLNKIDEETGLSIAQLRGLNKTLEICENGLSVAQNAAIKASQTKIKRGSGKGERTSKALIIHIFNAEGEFMFESRGNFIQVCEENGLILATFLKSYRLQRKIKRGPFKGWSAVKIGKCKDIKQNHDIIIL